MNPLNAFGVYGTVDDKWPWAIATVALFVALILSIRLRHKKRDNKIRFGMLLAGCMFSLATTVFVWGFLPSSFEWVVADAALLTGVLAGSYLFFRPRFGLQALLFALVTSTMALCFLNARSRGSHYNGGDYSQSAEGVWFGWASSILLWATLTAILVTILASIVRKMAKKLKPKPKKAPAATTAIPPPAPPAPPAPPTAPPIP